MFGAKTKTRRNIYAEIKNKQLKQTKRKEMIERCYFILLCVTGYAGYVLLGSF